MNTASHVRFWLIIFVILLVAAPMLRKGSDMDAYVRNEVALTERALGEAVGRWVVETSGLLFSSNAVKTILAPVAARVESDEKVRQTPRGMAMVVAASTDYARGLILAGYVACVRLLIVLVWFAILSPVLIAAVLDGMSQRALNRLTFGSIRPATFAIMSMIVIPFMLTPLLFLALPFSLPPTAIPFWVALGTVPLAVLVANSQPVFARM